MEAEAEKLLIDSEEVLNNVALPKVDKQMIPSILHSLKDYHNMVINKYSKKEINKKHFAFQDEAEKVLKKIHKRHGIQMINAKRNANGMRELYVCKRVHYFLSCHVNRDNFKIIKKKQKIIAVSKSSL